MGTSVTDWRECNSVCHQATEPIEYLNEIAGDEFSLLDGILFRGCFLGQRSCHKPLDSIQRKFKKQNQKIEKFYKARERKCQFRRVKGKNELYKGLGSWYPASFEPAPEFAATDENFKNSNWITDGDYDACSAAQKVLDAYKKFGEVFSRDCHWNKQTEEKMWRTHNKQQAALKKIANGFSSKLGGAFRDKNCRF